MTSYMTPPLSSSPIQIIHEQPGTVASIAAPSRRSSKRKKGEHDEPDALAPKRQLRSKRADLQKPKPQVEPANGTQSRLPGPQPADGVPLPPGVHQLPDLSMSLKPTMSSPRPGPESAVRTSIVKPATSLREQALSAWTTSLLNLVPPQYGLLSPKQPTQYHGDFATYSLSIYQHNPWSNPHQADSTPAPVYSQQSTPWYPGRPTFETPAPRPSPYCWPPSQLPLPGTAACPIVLNGDDAEHSMTAQLGSSQHLTPHVSSAYPAYRPPQWDENKENTSNGKYFANASFPQQNLADQPLYPLLRPLPPPFKKAYYQPPTGPRPASLLGTLHPSQTTGSPYDYSKGTTYLQGTPSHGCPPPFFIDTTGGPLLLRKLDNPIHIPSSAPSIDSSRAKADDPDNAPTSRPPDEPSLCPEQADLVDLILEGRNVFYTGSAGCGKSTVLRAFVKRLVAEGKKVRIVAPTGRAALNVGGTTTWSFAGWTPDAFKLSLQKLRDKAFGKTVKERLRETDVLVIDEISMVENHHFERLNEIMKYVRNHPHNPSRPFGGCQIVVTGDFCQLPPVRPFVYCMQCGKNNKIITTADGKLAYECRFHGTHADEDKWAFRSQAWEDCAFEHVHLKTVHRQNDQTFIRMLQKCRLGKQLTESEITTLMDHKCRVSQATKLFALRKQAENVNQEAFNKIQAQKHSFWALDKFHWRREEHPQLQWKNVRSEWRNARPNPLAPDAPPKDIKPLKALDEHRFSECVELKKGGLVVLLANIDLDAGLCNGSQGVICGFEDYDPSKMPIRYNEKTTLKPGQRFIRGDHGDFQEREIKSFMGRECVPYMKWPIVQFHNGLRRTVFAECSISQLGDEEPYSMLMRTQIPLAPAWAMTIHKSQSLTMDRVIVNLDRAFEEGQVYVALSRATGLSGLKIEGDGHFLRDKLMVNEQVAAFLREKFGDLYAALEAEVADSDEVVNSPH